MLDARNRGVARGATRSSSPPPAPWPTHTGGGAGPAPSPAAGAATAAPQPLAAAVAPAALQPLRAAVDSRALLVASVAGARPTGGDLDAGDRWRGLRHLGLHERAAGRREVVLDHAAERAIRGTRERAAWIEGVAWGGVETRGLDAGVLGLARAGKAEPLTGGRRRKWRSGSRSPAHVATEEALGAARLRTRRASAWEARADRRDYQSAIGMHGVACASGGRTWRPRGVEGSMRMP